MQRRSHRRLTVAGLAGVLALGAGFPAGGVSASEYADRICTSATEWVEEVGDLVSDLGEDVESASGAEEQQELAVDFLGDTIDVTETWRDEIRDAGTPDVRGGKAIAKAYRKGVRDSLSVLKDALEETEDLSTDDPEEFRERFDEVGDAIDEGLGEAGDALTEAEEKADEEYRDALQDEPACEELREAIGELA